MRLPFKASDALQRGAREGFQLFLPLSLGMVPWALVTGVAMRTTGLTLIESIAMNLLVFSGTAQLGTLPLLAIGAPLWLILMTAMALNLRFLIFSAALAPAFEGISFLKRLTCGYLLVDGVFALCSEKMLASRDKNWRLGFFLAPSLWGWSLWQVFVLIGALSAASIPKDWSLDFMVTIALITLLVPVVRSRPTLLAAIIGGGTAMLARGLPLKLGLIAGIIAGVSAGFAAEQWHAEWKTA